MTPIRVILHFHRKIFKIIKSSNLSWSYTVCRIFFHSYFHALRVCVFFCASLFFSASENLHITPTSDTLTLRSDYRYAFLFNAIAKIYVVWFIIISMIQHKNLCETVTTINLISRLTYLHKFKYYIHISAACTRLYF